MSIYDVLQRDHRALETMFKDLKKSRDPDDRYGIFEELETELIAHARAEEKVFYNPLRGKLREDVRVSKEEHDGLETLIQQMQDLEPNDRGFVRKAEQLEKLFNEHIRREEQEIFPQARKILGDDAKNELGERMIREKQRLLDRGIELVT